MIAASTVNLCPMKRKDGITGSSPSMTGTEFTAGGSSSFAAKKTFAKAVSSDERVAASGTEP